MAVANHRDRPGSADAASVLHKPVIVIGAPRSGTSVLARVLSAHRDVAFFSEPRLTWRYGNDSLSDVLRAHHATASVKDHIRAHFAKHTAAAGKTRMLEKTPSNSLRLPFVDAVFPDARFVHIMRDPVETCLSIYSRWHTHSHGFRIKRQFIERRVREIRPAQIPYYAREVLLRLFSRPGSGRFQNIWGPRIPGIHQMLRELDVIDIAALQWRMCVEAACQDGRRLGSDRYLECKLEDLDEPMLEKISTFCDLPADDAVIAGFRAEFDRSATSHRRAEAPADLQERIQWWTDPTVAWLQSEGAFVEAK